MKTFIILLAVLTIIRGAKSECFELVQQYYECKNLVMIDLNNLTTYPPSPLVFDDSNKPNENYKYPPKTYIPEPSIPNNQLNDTFYQSLNLTNMTIDQAMNLFRNIYNEIYNCSSAFCNCTKTGIIMDYMNGEYNRYSLYFLNETTLNQAKIILSDFNTKFQSNMKNYSLLQTFFKSKTHSNQTLPTLAQFCMKYDYTDERFLYYSGSKDCFTDDALVEDCKWDVQVNKSGLNVRYAGIDNFTNSEYERLLSCDLINLKSCPVETQRYFSLTNWVKQLPWLEWSGNSLKAYFDGIISQTYAYKEKIGFVKTTLKTFDYSIAIKNNKSWWIEMYSNQFKQKCLNSVNFDINLEWTPKPDRLTYMNNIWSISYMTSINMVIFTFYNYSYTFYDYNNSLNYDDLGSTSFYFDPSINSGFGKMSASSYIYYSGFKFTGISRFFFLRDPNYGLKDLFYIDRGSVSMHFIVNRTDFTLFLTKEQWKRSSGLLVNGNDPVITTTTTKATIATTTSGQNSLFKIITLKFYFINLLYLVFIFIF